MANSIAWEKDVESALARAQKENLPILLFFHNPGWIGCQQMDAVTYPNEMVQAFIQESLVPLLVPFDLLPLSKDFNIKWTPTLITLGHDKLEHHRTVGFLDPDTFIANQTLGIGKYHFDNDRYQEALAFFEKIISGYSESDCVAEATFLRGVSLYKSTGDPKPLKEAYETLSSRHPGSEWTKRAYPYRLL